MRIYQVNAPQAHAVPSMAYRTQFAQGKPDDQAVQAGSKGRIPGHLMSPDISWNPEILISDPEPELTGTAANGFAPVIMLRCIDCNAVVASTKTEDHICEPVSNTE